MNSTERFSSRVENYVKYRPHYPKTLVDELEVVLGLRPEHAVADVGSGTGISSELFLENGNTVFGIEPNREMRVAGEKFLEKFVAFNSVEGTAEATTLPASSVDFVLAGQAFHWFDRDSSRAEFERILKPDGWIVLIWNDRQTNASPFLYAYEELIRTFGTDYAQVNHQNIDRKQINDFFQHENIIELSFPNTQRVDYEGLKGRLLSSSYIADATDPRFAAMLRQLEELFAAHQVDQSVDILYRTTVYAGKLHRKSNPTDTL